jgi:predicted  nucleic acid-binding Zn-ribbon protein
MRGEVGLRGDAAGNMVRPRVECGRVRCVADPNEEMLKILRSIDAHLGRVEDEQKKTRVELGERLDKLEVHARATNESLTATNARLDSLTAEGKATNARLDRMDSRLIGAEEAAMSTNAVLRNMEKGLATLHEDMLSQGAKLTTIGGELAGLRQEAMKDFQGLHTKVTQLDERVTKLEGGGRPPTRARRAPRR